ncbi:MAG: EamA family transporter [Nitrospirota bacterium]|nr:EamA family transporter [Nitrospirota bacterium]
MNPVYLGMTLLCVAALAAGQVLFKLSARHVAGAQDISGLLQLALYPWFLLSLVLYGGATLLWVWILRKVPLTAAYPFFALTFLLVPLVGVLFLGERVDMHYWLGVGLIMGGIWITVA